MNGYTAECEGWFVGYMLGLREDRSEGWIGDMHSVGMAEGRRPKEAGLPDMIPDSCSHITDPRNILCKFCLWPISL